LSNCDINTATSVLWGNRVEEGVLHSNRLHKQLYRVLKSRKQVILKIKEEIIFIAAQRI
jgi:hypothetical protein